MKRTKDLLRKVSDWWHLNPVSDKISNCAVVSLAIVGIAIWVYDGGLVRLFQFLNLNSTVVAVVCVAFGIAILIAILIGLLVLILYCPILRVFIWLFLVGLLTFFVYVRHGAAMGIFVFISLIYTVDTQKRICALSEQLARMGR